MTINYNLKLLKNLVRLSYSTLLLVLAANLWQQGQPPFIFLLVLFPLAMFAPGIWVDNLRTLIWMGFVLLLYFAGAVFGVTKPEPSVLDIAELIVDCCVVLLRHVVYTASRQVNPDKTAED